MGDNVVAKSKNYKIDFFKLNLTDDNNAAKSFFSEIDVKDYGIISIGDDEYRVIISKKDSHILHGEIRKYRNKADKPVIAQRTDIGPDKENFLSLDDDEFLTDWNQFILTHKDVLLFQVNKSAAHISKFVGYWRKVFQHDLLYEVKLVEQNALQKILSGEYVYNKYELKVHVPENIDFYKKMKGSDLLTDTIINLKQQSSSAKTVKIEVSCGRSVIKMAQDNIANLVKSIKDHWAGDIEKATFSSPNPDGTVDLVKNFIKDEITVADDDDLEHRRVVVFDKLNQVYQERRSDINAVL